MLTWHYRIQLISFDLRGLWGDIFLLELVNQVKLLLCPLKLLQSLLGLHFELIDALPQLSFLGVSLAGFLHVIVLDAVQRILIKA